MIHAYIDESGQRGSGANASPTFILGGVVVRDRNAAKMGLLLEHLREGSGRLSGQHLHFNKVRKREQRLFLAGTIGAQSWLRGMCVVACKAHLPRRDLDDDHVYLYQLRMLLERLSWFAREKNEVASYTIAHVQKFKVEKLSEYEDRLRRTNTQIAWEWLDPRGGHINQPKRVQELQLADTLVSATGAAFNPAPSGEVETAYLRAISGCLYRRGKAALTSYGLKMHPWNRASQAAYPWVKAL